MKRVAKSRMFRRVACTRLPTRWGMFQTIGFQWEPYNGVRGIETAVALVLGEVTGNAPLLRIHSQCLTGDVLGSLLCDCGEQLELAMRAIAREGCGLLIYEHQEGRGIGLMASYRPTHCKTRASTRLKQIMHLASLEIVGISACRSPFCTTSVSAGFGFFQIIRRS